jgi:hypothetical protein
MLSECVLPSPPSAGKSDDISNRGPPAGSYEPNIDGTPDEGDSSDELCYYIVQQMSR